MSVTSPALARQAPACGLQGLGTLQRIRRANRANRAKPAKPAKRPKPTTASLRSTLIGAGRPKIGLQAPTTTIQC